MENYQAQPYGLRNTASNYVYNIQRCSDLCFIHRPWPKPRNFINMVRIEEYQEGSVHIVQEGGSSSPSGIASNGSVYTKLHHHDMKELNTIWISQTMPRGPHNSHLSRQGEGI